MSGFDSSQYQIPEELPRISKAWWKEVIRVKPKNIISFSRDYFSLLLLTNSSDLSKQCNGKKKVTNVRRRKKKNKNGWLDINEKRNDGKNETQLNSKAVATPALENNLKIQKMKIENRKHDTKSGDKINDQNYPRRSEINIARTESLKVINLDNDKRGSLLERAKSLRVQRESQHKLIKTEVDPESRKRKIWKKMFDEVDSDGNGTIDQKEVQILLEKLNFRHSPADVERLLSFLDDNSNGEIDFEEFLNWSEYTWKYQVLNPSSFSTDIGGSNRSVSKLMRPNISLFDRNQSTSSCQLLRTTSFNLICVNEETDEIITEMINNCEQEDVKKKNTIKETSIEKNYGIKETDIDENHVATNIAEEDLSNEKDNNTEENCSKNSTVKENDITEKNDNTKENSTENDNTEETSGIKKNDTTEENSKNGGSNIVKTNFV